MDLGFLRLDASQCEPVPAPLDYLRLVASLAAMQAASRTAAVEANLSAGSFEGTQPVDALVALLIAGPGWTEAVIALEGRFHPEIAATREIGPP